MTKVSSHHNLSPDSPQIEIDKISEAYNKRRYIYDAIINEATFIVNDSIINEKIKVHGVEARVKDLSSLIKKCTEKNVKDPF